MTTATATATTNETHNSQNGNHVKNNVSCLATILGRDLLEEIKKCRILLVGAGGIGCELLKNLSLSGFCHVQVVDLDTIDVSNLNRQLLFRRQHVGHPKCTTAAAVATQMANPERSHPVTYQAIHANVCDSNTFHKQWIQQNFDLVLNALDNLTARRRVNRLCLAASVPLIEAGTTGYLGQCNVVTADGQSACYECATVETPKVYPICTIRATPSQPVHTIVWAKEFYKLLFGTNPAESMLFEDVHALQDQVSTYMDSVLKVRQALHKINNNNKEEEDLLLLVAQLLTNLYKDEIQKQLDLGRYKTALKQPQPLSIDLTTQLLSSVQDQAPSLQPGFQATDVSCWTMEGCIAELLHVIQCFGRDSVYPEAFDKDHDAAMRFVTAASNLRNIVFQIDAPPHLQSLYSAKGIAGNIIPAIATTNAIAAGLQILQVYQVLAAKLADKKDKMNTSAISIETENKENKSSSYLVDRCRYTQILRLAQRNGAVITAVKLSKPNPNCFVCRQGTVEFVANTKQWTLQHFLKRILYQELGLQEPSVQIGLSDLIWEQGEDSDQATFEINLPKTLANLPAGGVKHGTIIRVDDFTQALEMSIHVTHRDAEDWAPASDAQAKQMQEEGGTATEEFPFLLKGNKPTGAAVEQPKPHVAEAKNKGHNDDDGDDDEDLCIVVSEKRVTEKRKEANDKMGNGGEDRDPGAPLSLIHTAKRRKLDPPGTKTERVDEVRGPTEVIDLMEE